MTGIKSKIGLSGLAKGTRRTAEEIDRHHIFTLALIIAISYLLLFAFTHVMDIAYGTSERYQGIKELNATLGAAFLVIIGYYFGKGPVTTLAKKVEEGQRENSKKEAALEDALSKMRVLEDRLSESTRVIEMVKPLADQE